MKKLTILSYTCIAIVLQSCTATISSHVPNPNIKLSKYYKKISILTNGDCSQSITTVNSIQGQLSQTHLMSGSAQLQMATDSLSFELEKLGFEVVNVSENPDLIIEFNIGSIRYDPLVGWIADKATVKMRDRQTNKTIALYQAKTMFITPTVDNIINKLSSEIKQNY